MHVKNKSEKICIANIGQGDSFLDSLGQLRMVCRHSEVDYAPNVQIGGVATVRIEDGIITSFEGATKVTPVVATATYKKD